MKNWHYLQNGEGKGPVDIGTIREFYARGEISGNDFVWEEGTEGWVEAGTVLGQGVRTGTAFPMELAGTPTPQAPPGIAVPVRRPVLTKAIGSLVCGGASMLLCLFGVPSILLGGAAVWLGMWVRKNFSGSTASEAANLYAWIGIITGGIGVILGVLVTIFTILGLVGGSVMTLDEMSRQAR